MPNIDEAIEALLSYQQADMEGVMVLTSRQAIHEVADELKRVRSHAQDANGNGLRHILQRVHNVMVKDIEGGDDLLWTDEYGDLYRDISDALASARTPAEVEGIAQLGVQEVADAWAILESHGFPPEVVGWPQENIAGKLPGAIENAFEALVKAREDILTEVIQLRAQVENAWQQMSSAPRDGTHFWAYQDGKHYECWWHDDWPRGGYWMDHGDTEPEPEVWRHLPLLPAPKHSSTERQDG